MSTEILWPAHDRPAANANEWGRNAMRLLDKHPAIDVCLYIRAIRGRMTFDQANKICKDVEARGPAARDLVAEMIEMLTTL